MRTLRNLFIVKMSLLIMLEAPVFAQAPIPVGSWVDQDTGHRVVQLTSEPNSKGLYFNENAFTPDGQMIYTANQSIFVLDIATRRTRQIVAGPVSSLIVGRRSANVYYMRLGDRSLYSAEVGTGRVSKLRDMPDHSVISTINSDETIIAGTYEEGAGVESIRHKPDPNLRATAVRATAMDERLAAHLPMVLFTLNLQTGAMRQTLRSTDWINHVQFSPTDPTLLMYCPEGLWYRVDRIWTIRTDGTDNHKIHTRTMNNEIAGHEFWDADGKTIWYDLQIPRGQNFYLASYNTETHARRWYSVERDAWSVHYNSASDGSLFCGDGGDYSQVAKSKNGQWIELLSPRDNPAIPEVDQGNLVQSGFFVTQHLVNMTHHDYRLEPNVRFSPDHKLVIFTSNMLGPSYVFAVEVAKAAPAAQ